LYFLGNCSFPGTFCEWKNDQDDDFDWEIGKGLTPSINTGPGRDVDGNGKNNTNLGTRDMT